MEANARAPKGGIVGINGYFYKGGRFLPNTTLPPKAKDGKERRNPTGRREVEPFVWSAPSKLPDAFPGERLRSYDGFYSLIPGVPEKAGEKIVGWKFDENSDVVKSAIYWRKEGETRSKIIANMREEFYKFSAAWMSGYKFRAIFEDEKGNITREVFFK